MDDSVGVAGGGKGRLFSAGARPQTRPAGALGRGQAAGGGAAWGVRPDPGRKHSWWKWPFNFPILEPRILFLGCLGKPGIPAIPAKNTCEGATDHDGDCTLFYKSGEHFAEPKYL